MLLQIGRGAVLLTSMALVACYIDVYATGRFPWQHTVAELPAEIPQENEDAPELEPFEFVAEPVAATPVFLPGSKSDVMSSSLAVQSSAPPASTPNAPVFFSGSKSFSGQTTVLSGALNPPSKPPAPQTQSFMGGSKTIMLPTRLPETTTNGPHNHAPTPPADQKQFMSGFKSPGPAVMPGSSIPAPTPRVQLPTQVPATSTPSANMPQQASPPNAANLPPLFMSGAKSPLRHADIPNASAPPPQQQQATPLKIVPHNAPLSPAGSY